MLIECDGLSVHLGKRKVLSNINLLIEPQEIVTILGPNGSGKTTLFKTLIGALQPSAGVVKKNQDYRLATYPNACTLMKRYQ